MFNIYLKDNSQLLIRVYIIKAIFLLNLNWKYEEIEI